LDSEIITPEEMIELGKSEQGRAFLKQYIIKARVAFSMQLVFGILDVIPEPEVQEACCDAVFAALQRVDIAVVMNWLQEAIDGASCAGMEC
jgi:hypothetical protein